MACALVLYPADAQATEPRTFFSYARIGALSLAAAPALVPSPAQPAVAPAVLPDAWTAATLSLVVRYQLNPVRASRVLAYVHAAMDDARIHARRTGLSEVAVRVAIHRAGSAVLGYLFPTEGSEKIEATGVALIYKELPRADELRKGWLVGNQVVAAAITRARSDGADRLWNQEGRPKDSPTKWQPTPPLWIFNPVEPVAGNWRTWLLRDGAEIEPEEPIPFESEEYKSEVREVMAVAKNLTPEQRKIAEGWNLDRGSVTPAGVWNKHALTLLDRSGDGLDRRTRILAVLNAAISDAFIACWQAKYRWWTIRPVTVARLMDSTFEPYLLTPPFPSYPSGHATVSGASAEVLSSFIPLARTELEQMAKEASESRLFGGIHFRHDNEQGLRLGRAVGKTVFERAGKE